jgi:hypothetical protein
MLVLEPENFDGGTRICRWGAKVELPHGLDGESSSKYIEDVDLCLGSFFSFSFERHRPRKIDWEGHASIRVPSCAGFSQFRSAPDLTERG